VIPGLDHSYRSRINTATGVELFCRHWGSGQSVVFVSSWGFSSKMWCYQMQHLATLGLHCVAYDRRGHGRSDQPIDGYDMDTLADDLASVIEELNLREVIVVGHSMGGAEIVRYMARHGSARIAKVVLVAPLTPFFQQTSGNPDGVPEADLAALREQWATDFPKWVHDNKDPFFAPETCPDTKAWLIDDMLGMFVPVLIACNRSLVSTDLRPDLAKIDRPTLILHGDADASAPLEITGKPTAAGIKGAVLKIYPGAPHGLFLTHVQEVNTDLAAFIRE
jgi:pimeloyl-ACP methyl ester carboxylesterase